jgi:DNA-binding IclR family transcriptional regulator
MARRAPAVDRAMAILNYLAAHPSDRFTLSTIARELKLNKATLHAILAALTGAGYLVRDPLQKNYGLGPAVVVLGNAALASYPAATIAQPEMQALSDELDLDCVASAPIGDEIVILARTGARPFGINIQPGQRIPLVPPLGTVFVAWSEPAEIDRWLGKVGTTKANLDKYRNAIDAVRDRGYSVGVTPPREAARTLEESIKGLRDEYALVELDASQRYRVNHIGAPVFGPSGEVTLALFLIAFHDQLRAEQVPQYADRLRGAASRVTKAIHGREP